MKTIAFAAEAGSVGKTTSAVTLAALLSEAGKRVLLIDLDPQANATYHCGIDQMPAAGEVLLRDRPIGKAVYAPLRHLPELLVLPASRDLTGDQVELTRTLGGEQRLTNVLAPLAHANVLDFVIIDCPGSMGLLTTSAIIASDAVVTATRPTLKELQGLSVINQTVSEIAQAYRLDTSVAAIIPCEVPAAAGAVYVDSMHLLTSNFPNQVTHPVRRSVRVPEAYSARIPLNLYAPADPVTTDYRAVLQDLMHKKIFGEGVGT